MKKNVTLKVDEKLYKQFRAYCDKRGLIVSRQFEIFIKQKISKGNK